MSEYEQEKALRAVEDHLEEKISGNRNYTVNSVAEEIYVKFYALGTDLAGPVCQALARDMIRYMKIYCREKD